MAGASPGKHDAERSSQGFGDSSSVPPASPPHRSRFSRLAVASLALALLCIALQVFALTVREWPWKVAPWATALLALVLGIAAHVSIRRRVPHLRGESLATAGIVISAVLLLLVGVVLATGYLSLASKTRARRVFHCVDNVYLMLAATRAYAADHGDMLPPAESWCDAVKPYVDTLNTLSMYEVPWDPFVCRERQHLPCGYAFNSSLSGRRLDALRDPAHTVVIFESDAGWNAHGGPELLPRKPSHFGRDVYGLADRSLPVDEQVPRIKRGANTTSDGMPLRWEP